MALIELENVEKTYPDGTRALRGVTFTIEKGEFVGIMGPSGSGKSTLLHTIGFLDRHTAGVYRFEGKTIEDYSKDALSHVRNKRMGFVFQAFNLLARTSVLDNVKLPLLYSDTSPAHHNDMALSAIESVGLSHRVHHESSQLSGGEKQRVAIARALVNDPSVVFADEPTGNLDSQSGQKIMEIIQNLNEKEGKTVILITHESRTAKHAERIIRFRDGAIEDDSKVESRFSAKDSLLK